MNTKLWYRKLSFPFSKTTSFFESFRSFSLLLIVVSSIISSQEVENFFEENFFRSIFQQGSITCLFLLMYTIALVVLTARRIEGQISFSFSRCSNRWKIIFVDVGIIRHTKVYFAAGGDIMTCTVRDNIICHKYIDFFSIFNWFPLFSITIWYLDLYLVFIRWRQEICFSSTIVENIPVFFS